MSKYVVYGIKNCNSVKKVLDALTKKKVDFEFYDFKKQAPSSVMIKRWKKSFPDIYVNTKGMTYRKHKDTYESLSAPEKERFLIENSSMLKRPIIETSRGRVVSIGVDLEHFK